MRPPKRQPFNNTARTAAVGAAAAAAAGAAATGARSAPALALAELRGTHAGRAPLHVPFPTCSLVTLSWRGDRAGVATIIGCMNVISIISAPPFPPRKIVLLYGYPCSLQQSATYQQRRALDRWRSMLYSEVAFKGQYEYVLLVQLCGSPTPITCSSCHRASCSIIVDYCCIY
eukprot:2316341-Pleurochrysis_carterae.AAC.5